MSDTWATRSISTQHYHPKSTLTSKCTNLSPDRRNRWTSRDRLATTTSTECYNIKTSVVSHGTYTHYNSCSTDQFVAMNLTMHDSDDRSIYYSESHATFWLRTEPNCGPGSSVGIATDYGLDCPGSNPGGDEIFCPSRPALGPTEPAVQRVPGLSRG